jgi:hypothetical protein
MRVGDVGEVARTSVEGAGGPVTTRLREEGSPRPMEGTRPRPLTHPEALLVWLLGLSANGRGGIGRDSLSEVPKKASVLELEERAGLTAPSLSGVPAKTSRSLAEGLGGRGDAK